MINDLPLTVPRQRTLSIYAERAASRSRGCQSQTKRYQWGAKHPGEDGFWCVDAKAFCEGIGDRLFSIGYSVVSGDGNLTVSGWKISCDGLRAGLWLNGGTPGAEYWVRIRLTCLQRNDHWMGDVLISIENVEPIPTPNPSYLTVNGDIALLCGIPFPSGV